MSDKFRVMFDVPADVKTSKLCRPVEISEDDYVMLRMAEHKGDKELMASYVMKKYLKKGSTISGSDVSMTAAVGNPFHIMLIDQAIEEGRNPLEDMKRKSSSDDDDNSDDDEEEKDYSTNAIDKIIIKYLPFWGKFSKDARQKVWSVISIICIMLTYSMLNSKYFWDFFCFMSA